jgi:hypothetical protein
MGLIIDARTAILELDLNRQFVIQCIPQLAAEKGNSETQWPAGSSIRHFQPPIHRRPWIGFFQTPIPPRTDLRPRFSNGCALQFPCPGLPYQSSVDAFYRFLLDSNATDSVLWPGIFNGIGPDKAPTTASSLAKSLIETTRCLPSRGKSSVGADDFAFSRQHRPSKGILSMELASPGRDETSHRP